MGKWMTRPNQRLINRVETVTQTSFIPGCSI